MSVLAVGLGAFQTDAAVLFPSIFQPIRSGIVDEIQALTNSPPLTPEESRRLRLLNQARRNIDRAGRPSLFGDVQVLASVNNNLTRLFPGGQFTPLMESAIFDFRDLLSASAVNLADTIAQLPPSSSTTFAAATVEEIIDSLALLDTGASVPAGMQVITRAATRLRSAEGFVSRARFDVVRVSRMTAFVDGQRFEAIPTGTYNGAVEFLTVSGRETGGVLTRNRSIQLSISDVTPGTTTHSLGSPGSGSFATFSERTLTNSVGIPSLSGNAIITLDARTGIVTGRFSFTAQNAFTGEGPVRVTSGEFVLRLGPVATTTGF
jgi:hypothetical protein